MSPIGSQRVETVPGITCVSKTRSGVLVRFLSASTHQFSRLIPLWATCAFLVFFPQLTRVPLSSSLFAGATGLYPLPAPPKCGRWEVGQPIGPRLISGLRLRTSLMCVSPLIPVDAECSSVTLTYRAFRLMSRAARETPFPLQRARSNSDFFFSFRVFEKSPRSFYSEPSMGGEDGSARSVSHGLSQWVTML